jgi:hypothetical protein
MSEEIQSVEENINQNLAQVIAGSGLDYRIVMFSFYGDSKTSTQVNGSSMFQGTYGVCVRAPLSGNGTCSPVPMRNTDGQRFFHYGVNVGSTNSLTLLLDGYAAPGLFGTGPQGWGALLRPEAYKAFVEITDDNQRASGGIFGGGGLSAQQFEQRLTALMPNRFGTVQNRNYVFHSIIGVAPKANPDDPYLPTEPIVSGKCSTAVNAGATYQDLSIATGGLRFPMCDPSKYGTVFRKVAEGVVASAQVACDFAVPPPPAGFTLSNRIYVTYTPSNGGAAVEFAQVKDAASCAPQKFYVANNRVVFCPDTCNTVRNDGKAKVEVRFTCEVGIN